MGDELYERARSAFPSVAIPPEEFLSYLRERAPDPAALKESNLQEIYLTCGCVRGDTSAIQIVIERYLGRVKARFSRGGRARSDVEEILQQMQEDLLVAKPGQLPRISQYRGAGSLFSWLASSASRLYPKLFGPGPPLPYAVPAPQVLVDPELAEMRRRHGKHFLQALHDAIRLLPSDDWSLFRMNAVGGLSTVSLAKVFGQNQSTISRNLKRVREKVRRKTTELLKERLDLSTREAESMMDVPDSELDMSISQLFNKEEPE